MRQIAGNSHFSIVCGLVFSFIYIYKHTASLELEAVEDDDEGEGEEEFDDTVLRGTAGSTALSSGKLLLHSSSSSDSTSRVTSFAKEKYKKGIFSFLKLWTYQNELRDNVLPLQLRTGSLLRRWHHCALIQSRYSATSCVTRIIRPRILGGKDETNHESHPE